jgi:ABC-type ATPase involved in cell division
VASVELRGLTKRYGDIAVVDDISLAIEHGHLVCLLGPSGCGKTTTLRLIAGFVEPSEGEIRVGDKLISSPAHSLPPERRNMSMIFQSYALWPHLTVAENIVYGLKLRKLDRDTIAQKLAAIFATTRLAALADRYPRELSGGQQQRVALAHALADNRAAVAHQRDRDMVLHLSRRHSRIVGGHLVVHLGDQGAVGADLRSQRKRRSRGDFGARPADAGDHLQCRGAGQQLARPQCAPQCGDWMIP